MRRQKDKFCLIRDLWKRFIENSQMCYIPDQFLTADEHLLPTRCYFLQYMPKKPDKFGIKFWNLVCVNSNYLVNSFPYLGKNCDKIVGELKGEYVVKKLMGPYMNKGYCVKYRDNLFIILKTSQKTFFEKKI